MSKSRSADSPFMAHARRELEMAGAFVVNDELDGTLGRTVMGLVRLTDKWCGDNNQMREAIGQAFTTVISGGLLSMPTDNADEWAPVNVEEGQPDTWRNIRNPFYVSNDAGKTWYHLMSKQKGESRHVDSNISIPDPLQTTSKEDDSNVNTDGKTEATSNESVHSGPTGAEGQHRDTGVASKSPDHASKSKTAAAKPKGGEAK